MKNRVIAKDAVADYLGDLLREQKVYAPVRREGLVSFEAIQSGDQAVLDVRNTKRPPKEIFFPRSEVLFVYEDGEISAVPLPEDKLVVFGIRPCDARSLTMLDKVFRSSVRSDPYYEARRENATLVGLGCNHPWSTCFCSAVEGGPFDSEGLDLLLTDLGDAYLAEPITERGEALIADSPRFRDATADDLEAKAEIVARVGEVTGPDTEGVKAKLDVMYDAPFWDALQEKCIGCGLCTYVCPTCHCFDVQDEAENGCNGCRMRNWDSCQFSLFTLHASGHNPRPSGKERMRQRVMHKFDYFVDNYEDMACVGCGRCVRECPVNLDIRATLKAICES